MRRPFWVKGSTPRDTFRINFYLVRSIIADIAMTILWILCFLGILCVLFYKIPKALIDAGKEASAASDKLKSEQGECFMKEYAGKKFYKFNLEGHEYWCIETHNNHLGFCHSESCYCKTNKTEVVQ